MVLFKEEIKSILPDLERLVIETNNELVILDDNAISKRQLVEEQDDFHPMWYEDTYRHYGGSVMPE